MKHLFGTEKRNFITVTEQAIAINANGHECILTKIPMIKGARGSRINNFSGWHDHIIVRPYNLVERIYT